MLVAIALLPQAEEIADLGQSDEQPGAGHETDYDGGRDIARQIAEAKQRDKDLDSARQYRQEKHGFHGIGVVRGSEG